MPLSLPVIAQLRPVAAESLRVLAPDGQCTPLIGDLRRRGRGVPLGFAAIQKKGKGQLPFGDMLGPVNVPLGEGQVMTFEKWGA
jgi:hypothetical protein